MFPSSHQLQKKPKGDFFREWKHPRVLLALAVKPRSTTQTYSTSQGLSTFLPLLHNSWNTYPARLSVHCQIDSACIFAYMYGIRVALLTVTTTCDFERGGARKPIIGSSWNNGARNRLNMYQVQKRPSIIMLIVFPWLRHVCDPAGSIFQYFFADTHTHRHEGIALPLLRMRSWSKNSVLVLFLVLCEVSVHVFVHARVQAKVVTGLPWLHLAGEKLCRVTLHSW